MQLNGFGFTIKNGHTKLQWEPTIDGGLAATLMPVIKGGLHWQPRQPYNHDQRPALQPQFQTLLHSVYRSY
jgi:hypothetical protein